MYGIGAANPSRLTNTLDGHGLRVLSPYSMGRRLRDAGTSERMLKYSGVWRFLLNGIIEKTVCRVGMCPDIYTIDSLSSIEGCCVGWSGSPVKAGKKYGRWQHFTASTISEGIGSNSR